jgi:hypothetical protein
MSVEQWVGGFQLTVDLVRGLGAMLDPATSGLTYSAEPPEDDEEVEIPPEMAAFIVNSDSPEEEGEAPDFGLRGHISSYQVGSRTYTSRSNGGDTIPFSEMIQRLEEIGSGSVEFEIGVGPWFNFESDFEIEFSGELGSFGHATLKYRSDGDHLRVGPQQVEISSDRMDRIVAYLDAAPREPGFDGEYRVFLGHGHGSDWKTIQQALESAGFRVEAYESGGIAGQTAISIIIDMIHRCSSAVIYMTPDDLLSDGKTHRARQNVVHEIGLAQGILGQLRTVIVQHEDVEMPTNLAGVNVVRHAPSALHDKLAEIVAYVEKSKLVGDQH